MDKHKLEKENNRILQAPEYLVVHFVDDHSTKSNSTSNSKSRWEIFPVRSIFGGDLLLFELSLLVTVEAVLFTRLQYVDFWESATFVLMQVLLGLTMTSVVFQAFESLSRALVFILACLKLVQVSIVVLLIYLNRAIGNGERNQVFCVFLCLGIIALYIYIFYLCSNFQDDDFQDKSISHSQVVNEKGAKADGNKNENETKEEDKQRRKMSTKILHVFSFVDAFFSLALVTKIILSLDIRIAENSVWLFRSLFFGLAVIIFSGLFCFECFCAWGQLNALKRIKEQQEKQKKNENSESESEPEFMLISCDYKDCLQIYICTSLQLIGTLILLGIFGLLGETFNADFVHTATFCTLGPLLTVHFVVSVLGRILYNNKNCDLKSKVFYDESGEKIIQLKLEV